MAGHDDSPLESSELQQVVNQVLTPFQPEFQHIDEHPVVLLSALEAALSAAPVMPIQHGDPRFVQLMSELEAQLMSEAETDGLFNLDLPELLPAPASQGRRPAPIDTPPQPIQPAASMGNNGGGVEETRINSASGSAIPRSRTQSRVHRRPAAERPSPLTAGAEGSRRGIGVRAPRRASSSSSTVPAEQRQEVPIQPERQQRVTMAELFSTLREILPTSVTSSATDKSSVVKGAINYIAALEAEIERLQAIAVRANAVANGGRLICFDHTGDASALTAVTTLPVLGSDASTLASFLGANVTVQVCAQSYFVTVSSPRSMRLFNLLFQIVVVIFRNGLEILCVTTVDSDNTVVFNIVCQGSETANLLTNTLHIALQNVVDNFIRNLSCN